MIERIIFATVQDILFFALVIFAGWLFGKAFYKIYKGQDLCTSKIFAPIEKSVYKALGVDHREEMTVKQYALSVLWFSFFGLILLWAMLMCQAWLPFNPNDIGNMRWDTALNTAISFVTNTNWQAYSGEIELSYFSQMMGLTVQNFVSGAVGIAVLFALIRGFTNREKGTIGNFWQDMTKIIMYMLPICFFGSLILVSQGVPQTFNGAVYYSGVEGANGALYLGPGASQIMIKQIFTNGGGFYGTNSAYPFENPTALSNIIQCGAIIAIPIGLCYTFGRAVKESKQGTALLKAMSVIFIICLVVCTTFEFLGGQNLEGVVSFGNMEGKESRFGVGSSALWAVVTTSASNGSVNAMMDSFTPIGGMIAIFLMMIGEVIYGGVGSGLYGMIAFAILTVFISGLMVGRTPEYVGKKINAFDMKMVCLIILPSVLCTLIATAATVLLPIELLDEWCTNTGAHSFTEILYAFVSQSNNNGSAFAGFFGATPWTNLVGGACMLLNRFIPIVATVALGGSLGKKKITPASDGTLNTTNVMFVGLLVGVVLIIAALSYFPALALGPIAEQLA